MGRLRAISRAGAVPAALLLLAACAADNNKQSRQLGDYFITVSTDPPKLEVGSAAAVTAHIARDDQDIERCRVSFRQYMPDHQMTTDHARHIMNDLGKGFYRAAGSEFSMGGDWEIEFQFNCGDGMKTIVFPYKLVWM
jgi:hypothetical protein